MKRIAAACVLIILIGTVCAVNGIYIEKTYEDFKTDITELKSVFKEDNAAAAKKSAELEEKWVAKEDFLSLFVNHDIVDTLGVSIAKLPVYAQENSPEMFLSECRGIELELLHMLKDAQITTHSVF